MFHRITIVSLAILTQLLFLIFIIQKFYDYFAFFYGTTIFISTLAVLWIIYNNINPAYKIAWIIPIVIFPIFGGIFYIFFGGNRLSRRERKKMKLIYEKSQEVIAPNSSIIEEIESQNLIAANQSKYIQDYAFSPPYKNTFSEYLPIGEVKFERLIEELKKAEKYIFLEYFIIEEGVMWNTILGILVEKARAGVDVRVIYDDVGCLLTLPYNYDKKLEKMGIKCCVFNPFIPVLSSRLNNRDHRKITVIDGHTAFTGGINLADEYINAFEKHGHWKDTAVMLKGEAVWSLTVMFLSLWDYIRGANEDFKRFKNDASFDGEFVDDGYVQPFTDSPLDDEAVGEIVYLNLINKAKKYVYITTPYLIIDSTMITALSSAAKSGVDVRIITPHCADKWYVHAVTRSYYQTLIESGVKIYEYTPGFIHSKTYVVDDEYSVVGTINMDYRSLYLHFECGVWMYNSSSVLDIRNDFLETVKLCEKIKIEDLAKVKWYKALLGLILRVFSPLM